MLACGIHLCASLYTLKRMYPPLDIFVKAYIMEIVDRSPKSYDLALLFAALSDRTRLRLLNLMDGREVCVCYFVEILGQGQPKISRHLAYLRRAGVVAARREGKWMHYKIVVPHTPEQPESFAKRSQLLEKRRRCRSIWRVSAKPAVLRRESRRLRERRCLFSSMRWLAPHSREETALARAKILRTPSRCTFS